MIACYNRILTRSMVKAVDEPTAATPPTAVASVMSLF